MGFMSYVYDIFSQVDFFGNLKQGGQLISAGTHFWVSFAKIATLENMSP